MKKYIKQILTGLGIIIIGLSFFVGYGLYLIDIEDRYGDLQKIYFDSKSGDLVINNITGKTGILEIKDRRMFIKDAGKTININEWLDPQNEYIFNLNVYRPENPKAYLNLTRKEFDAKLKTENTKSISHIEIK